MGNEPIVLQATHARKSPMGPPEASKWFYDITVSSGVLLSYLVAKSAQKVCAKYYAESKAVAQELCMHMINELLADSDLQITPTLHLSLQGTQSVCDARPLVHAALAEDCANRRQVAAIDEGWAWLLARWQELRVSAPYMAGTSMDHTSIGAAIVLLWEEFGDDHVTRSMNVIFSVLAIATQAADRKAKSLCTSKYLSEIHLFRTASGKQQSGATQHQDRHVLS